MLPWCVRRNWWRYLYIIYARMEANGVQCLMNLK